MQTLHTIFEYFNDANDLLEQRSFLRGEIKENGTNKKMERRYV